MIIISFCARTATVIVLIKGVRNVIDSLFADESMNVGFNTQKDLE